MSRSNDLAVGSAGVLLALLALLAYQRRQKSEWYKTTDKGGRGAGPAATSTPVPQGSTTLWSEATMRLFRNEMFLIGIDARLVLLGIAASSHFNADEQLGENTGLLMVRREHLEEVGCPDAQTFETLDAAAQIPWIAKVLAHRIDSTGGRPPTTIADLAAMVHPQSNPMLERFVRNEAEKRAEEARGTMLFLAHDNLLRHVMAQARD